MSIFKSVKARGGYNAGTFNENNDLLVGVNGVLTGGQTSTSGSTVTVQPLTWIQNGLMVTSDQPLAASLPSSLTAPYYVAVTTSSVIENPAEIVTPTFVKRPEDVSVNTVLVAEWDGNEWRQLPYLSHTNIIQALKTQAVQASLVGVASGLDVAPSGSNLVVAPGSAIVVDGSLVTKTLPTSLQKIAPDANSLDRIDEVVFRKPTDDPSRIATLKYVVGPTFNAGGTVQLFTPQSDSGVATQAAKILNQPANGLSVTDNLYIIVAEGSSPTVTLKYLTAPNATTSPTSVGTLATGVDTYDAILNPDGNIDIIYVKGAALFYQRINTAGGSIFAETQIYTNVNSITNPKLVSIAQGSSYFLHIVFERNTGGSAQELCYLRLSASNTIETPFQVLVNLSATLKRPFLAKDDDDAILYLGFENQSTAAAFLYTFDAATATGSGAPHQATSPVTLQDDTFDVSTSTLLGSTGATNVRVVRTANKETFVFWMHDKGGGVYGIATYNSGYLAAFGHKAIVKDIGEASESVLAYSASVDGLNVAHFLILESDGDVLAANFRLSDLLVSEQTSVATGGVDVATIFNSLGSLVHAYATGSGSFYVKSTAGLITTLRDRYLPSTDVYIAHFRNSDGALSVAGTAIEEDPTIRRLYEFNNAFAATAQITWGGSSTHKLVIQGNFTLNFFNRFATYTIPANGPGGITIPDGWVLYVEVPDEDVSQNLTPQLIEFGEGMLDRHGRQTIPLFWSINGVLYTKFAPFRVGAGGDTVIIGDTTSEVETFFGGLRLFATSPNSTTVTVTATDQALLDATTLGENMLGFLLAFIGAKINFATGVVLDSLNNPLGVNFTPATISANNWLWYSVSANPTGLNGTNEMQVDLQITPAASSASTMDAAPRATFTGIRPIGQVAVHDNGSGGAGTITNIAQSQVVQVLASGSGGGGSSPKMIGGGTGSYNTTTTPPIVVPGPLDTTAAGFVNQNAVAQTFTATATTGLVSFSFNLNLHVTGSSGTLEAFVYNVASPIFNFTRTPSQALGHVSIPVSGLTSGVQDVLITLPTPTSLINGNFYALVLAINSTSITFDANERSPSFYSGGERFTTPNYVGGGFSGSSVDLIFTANFITAPVDVQNLTEDTGEDLLSPVQNNSGTAFLVPVSSTLDSFSLALWNENGVTGNIALQIYSGFVSGSGGTGLLEQSIDLDVTTLPPNGITPTLATFNFTTPISLVGGQTYYAIVIKSTGYTDGGFGKIELFSKTNLPGPFIILANIYNPGTTNLTAYFQTLITPTPITQFSFTSAFLLEFPGLNYADNTIPTTQSPIIFAGPEHAAYVIPNLSSGGPSLTVTVDTLPNVPRNAIIIARTDVNDDAIVGTSSTRFKLGDSFELYYHPPETGGNGTDLNGLQYNGEWVEEPFALLPTSPFTGVDNSSGKTNATYSTQNKLYTMSYDAGQAVTGTGTSMHTVDASISVLGPPDSNEGIINNSPTPKAIAQSFTATSDTNVVSFSFNIALTVTGATGTLEAYLFQIPSPSAPFTRTPGQALANVSIPVSGLSTGTQDLLVTFGTPIPVTNGSFYAVVLGVNSNDAHYNINIRNDVYSGGTSYFSTDYTTGSYTVPFAVDNIFTVNFFNLPSFTVAPGDILRVGLEAKKITAIGSINTDGGTGTPFTIESAFSTDPTSAAACLSQAVYTKDLNNTVASNGIVISATLTDAISELLLSYNDTTSGTLYNYVDPALVAYVASSDGTTYCGVSARIADLSDTLPVTGLPSAGTNLFIRFFSNALTGSGTVNLTKMHARFHRDAETESGGIFFQASCMTDGSGTPINCVLDNSGPKTIIRFTNFSYPVGVNPGTKFGAGKFFLSGKVLPRFVDAATTPDSSHTEISANAIMLDALYSSVREEFDAYFDIGIIDTNTQNTTAITAIVQSSLQNDLINGGFDRWFYGQTFTINNGSDDYTADRWFSNNGLGTSGSITYSQVAPMLTGSKWGMSVQINTAPTASQANATELYQTLTTDRTRRYLDNPACFAIFARGLGNVTQVGIQLMYATTQTRAITPLGPEQTINVNTSTMTLGQLIGVVVPSTVLTSTGVLGVRVRILAVSSGNTWDLNNGFVVEQGMLNVGVAPVPFQRAGFSPEGDIDLCMGFAEKSYDEDVNAGTITVTGAFEYQTRNSIPISTSGTIRSFPSIPFLKRKVLGVPNVVFYSSVTGAADTIFNESTSQDVSTVTQVANSERNFYEATVTSASSAISPDDILRWHWTAIREIT